jgi:hypothetical protein
MKVELTKAHEVIKVGAAYKRHVLNKTDMRIDNFNQIHFYYILFMGAMT